MRVIAPGYTAPKNVALGYDIGKISACCLVNVYVCIISLSSVSFHITFDLPLKSHPPLFLIPELASYLHVELLLVFKMKQNQPLFLMFYLCRNKWFM